MNSVSSVPNWTSVSVDLEGALPKVQSQSYCVARSLSRLRSLCPSRKSLEKGNKTLPNYRKERSCTRWCTHTNKHVKKFSRIARQLHQETIEERRSVLDEELLSGSRCSFRDWWKTASLESKLLVSLTKRGRKGTCTFLHRLNVGKAMNEHVFGKRTALNWSLFSSAVMSVAGTALHPVSDRLELEESSPFALLEGPIWGIVGGALPEIACFFAKKAGYFGEETEPAQAVIDQVSKLTSTTDEDLLEGFMNKPDISSKRKYVKKLTDKIEGPHYSNDLGTILSQIATIYMSPLLPNAGLRVEGSIKDGLANTLARLPDSEPTDKAATAFNATSFYMQIQGYLAYSFSRISTPLVLAQKKSMFAVSAAMNLPKLWTKHRVPIGQYDRELLKHMWHLLLSYHSFCKIPNETSNNSLSDEHQKMLQLTKLKAVIPNFSKLSEEIKKLDVGSRTEVIKFLRTHSNSMLNLLITMGERDKKGEESKFGALTALGDMIHDPSPGEAFKKALTDEDKLEGWYKGWIEDLTEALRLFKDQEREFDEFLKSPTSPDVVGLMENHQQFDQPGEEFMEKMLPKLLDKFLPDFPEGPTDRLEELQGLGRQSTLEVSRLSEAVRLSAWRVDVGLTVLNHLLAAGVLFSPQGQKFSESTMGEVVMALYSVASLGTSIGLAASRSQWVIKNGCNRERILGKKITPQSAFRSSDSINALFAAMDVDEGSMDDIERKDEKISELVRDILLLRRPESSDNETYIQRVTAISKFETPSSSSTDPAPRRTIDEDKLINKLWFLFLFASEVKDKMKVSDA